MPERYAHYDALIFKGNDGSLTKNIIQQILNKTIENRQNNELEELKIKIMIWHSNSIGDFTVKSFLIQQLHENNIDIALKQETMLKENDTFYIKNYRIFRANSNFREELK